MASRPKPEHDTFDEFMEAERVAQEDQRLAQQGMVKLKVGQDVSYKHIEELTREDRQARIAAEREEVEWLKERVKLLKERAEAPPIPTHLR